MKSKNLQRWLSLVAVASATCFAGCAGGSIGPTGSVGLPSSQNVVSGVQGAQKVIPNAKTLVTVKWRSGNNPSDPCTKKVVEGAEVYMALSIKGPPIHGQKPKTGPKGMASLWGYPTNVKLFLHAEKIIGTVKHGIIKSFEPGKVPAQVTLCLPPG